MVRVLAGRSGAAVGLLSVVAIGLGACVLQAREGRYDCDPDVVPSSCPAGWTCRADHLCWSVPEDDAVDLPDVPNDGCECVFGATRVCATACTTVGEQPCGSGCTWGACVGTVAELCNGIDDDCDGRTDETFVLESDAANCGACGNVCSGGGCYRGRCFPAACFDGRADGDESDIDCGGTDCPGCLATRTCGFGSDCESGRCSGGTCTLGCNLLVNASGELGGTGTAIPGWSVLENDGSGWTTEAWITWAPDERKAHDFATSYGWDRKGQTVDVRAAGFAPSQLATRPDIYVGEWVRRRWDSGSATTDRYYILGELLDGSGTPLARWDHGSRAAPLDTPADDDWHVAEHTFSGYSTAPGSVYFEDGGADREFWVGFYGTKFDGGRVTVLGLPCPSCHDGVRNQGEAGIDCGGICAACP